MKSEKPRLTIEILIQEAKQFCISLCPRLDMKI